MAGKRGNKLANIEGTILKKDRRPNIPTEELRDQIAAASPQIYSWGVSMSCDYLSPGGR